MRFCTDVCLESRIIGVPAVILIRHLPKTNQKPHRLVRFLIMVFQISEMNELIIIWLIAIEFVFDHAWYKYEIIGYYY
jgi:hypothetical protein